MNMRTLETEYLVVERSEQFNWLERYFLRRMHPRNIFFDSGALMWGSYFLWNQDWPRALVVVAGISVLGLLSVLSVDPEKMADTTLGKIGLLHLHPVNFIIQVIGMFPFVYGVWLHSAEFILAGFSVILFGHIFGWSKVNANFSVADNGVT